MVAASAPVLRVLVVTNLLPTPDRPAYGRFVLDQIAALRRIDDIELDVFSLPPGGLNYVRRARALRRAHRAGDHDVIHAHFGLTAWTALAVRGAPHAVTFHGTDLAHRRSGRVSRAALPFLDLPAAVSAALGRTLPGAGSSRRVAVLPCGVDTDRFHPIDRARAREELGLDPGRAHLLFPSDPARAEKRYDRALEAAGPTPVKALVDVHPDAVALHINAANAVIVPSDREGFGLAVLEALACDVPVLATPVGIAPFALGDLAGCLCAPWDRGRFGRAAQVQAALADPRVDGRPRAMLFSAERMAARVAAAWRDLASP